jgi:hypothetical protein
MASALASLRFEIQTTGHVDVENDIADLPLFFEVEADYQFHSDISLDQKAYDLFFVLRSPRFVQNTDVQYMRTQNKKNSNTVSS